jgi:Protein of unknown function (DUF3617)
MRTSILCGLIVMLSSVVWAADDIQPLDVKLGLWESTWTNQVSGMPPMPADALANLTPEQRAKVEDAMKARGNGMPTVRTRKQCMTKEKLEKDTAFEDQKSCTHTVTSSTSHKLEVKLECAEQGMKSSGTFRVEAIDSENVKGAMQMVASGGDHTMNINANFTSKWLSADCGTVK